MHTYCAAPDASRDFPASPAMPVDTSIGDTTADHDALLRLIACGGRAAPRRLLLARARPAEALRAGPSLWRSCGLSPGQVAVLQRPPVLERARAWLDHPDHHLLGWHHPDYPPLLRRTPSPPVALFVAGDPTLLWHPAVAIVGSRSPTPAGREHASTFAKALSAAGLAVASGLAAGIDTAAHHATLRAGGRTVAVLGTGPDVPYPRTNVALHAAIASEGAIISEHLPGTGPRREHFPSRNRILAGLGLGTLVVEAAYRSGALITARLAAESGREVMALPGSIHNPLARGCHRLIRDGAALIERPEEVVELLGPLAERLAGDLRRHLAGPTSCPAPDLSGSNGRKEAPGRSGASAGPMATGSANAAAAAPPDPQNGSEPGADHKLLWQALGDDPTDMDQLVVRTGLTTARLSSILLLMELEGRVEAQHGRYYRSR